MSCVMSIDGVHDFERWILDGMTWSIELRCMYMLWYLVLRYHDRTYMHEYVVIPSVGILWLIINRSGDCEDLGIRLDC